MSAPEPGLGSSESCTGLQVRPLSFDSLTCSRCGGGPLSRMYVTSAPFARVATLGWMLPGPTSGSLNCHVAPLSSVSAMSEKLKPSE